MDFPEVLSRINAPALRDLTVCDVCLCPLEYEYKGNAATSRIPAEAAARKVILQCLLLQFSKSLESVQLHANVVVKDDTDARPGLSSTNSSRTIFPNLISMSLCPEDYISELIDAPNLRHLEIRHPLQATAQHLDYSSFRTAETLVIASAGHVKSLCAALKNMRSVRHLQIRVNPDQLTPWSELRFLRSLSMLMPSPSPSLVGTDLQAATTLKSELEHYWLLPNLCSIDLHFASWAENSYRLQDPGIQPDDDPPADEDFVPDDVSSVINDPAEYYSDSSRWNEDVVGPNVVAKDSMVMGSEDLGRTSNVSEFDDDALECAQQPWPLELTENEDGMPSWPGVNIRGAYGHFLHALQDLVSARREVQEAVSLESVKISIGRRVCDDFAPPDELRLWFEANFTKFDISKTGKNSCGLPRPLVSCRHRGALGVKGEHPALQEWEKVHTSSLECSGALGSGWDLG